MIAALLQMPAAPAGLTPTQWLIGVALVVGSGFAGGLAKSLLDARSAAKKAPGELAQALATAGKLDAERDGIEVQSLQTLVSGVVQRLMSSLEERVEEQARTISQLRLENDELRAENAGLRRELEEVHDENRELTARLASVEGRVTTLEGETGGSEGDDA